MKNVNIVVINKFKSNNVQERHQKIKEIIIRYIAKEIPGNSYYRGVSAESGLAQTH